MLAARLSEKEEELPGKKRGQQDDNKKSQSGLFPKDKKKGLPTKDSFFSTDSRT
jgi:hypothetical protein